jgi:adenylate cyclase
LGLTGVATRSIIDFQERSLVERALSGYVSEDRLRRILSGAEKLKLTGRKAHLTTMLVDIAGFSKISHELPPEDVFAFIQKFFGIVDPIIFKHGGTIDKKTGDGLLAFFGDNSLDPKTATIEASRAALEMQAVLKETTPEFFGLNNSAINIQTRIGINAGDMIIGNAGSEKHFNYTVFGEAVNFTQRLEAACPVGSVLLGEEPAKSVEDVFELEPKQISVKNEAGSFLAYQIIGPKNQKSA